MRNLAARFLIALTLFAVSTVSVGVASEAPLSDTDWRACFGRATIDANSAVQIKAPDGMDIILQLTLPRSVSLTPEQMEAWRTKKPIVLSEAAELVSSNDATRVLVISSDTKVRPFVVTGSMRFRLHANSAVMLSGEPSTSDVVSSLKVKLPSASSNPGVTVETAAKMEGVVQPDLEISGNTLSPRLLPSKERPEIYFRLARPGVDFSSAEVQGGLVGCVVPASSSESAWRADVSKVTRDGIGAAFLTLAIPADLDYQTMTVLVADRNGLNARKGMLWSMERWKAVIIAAAVILIFYGIVGTVMTYYSARLKTGATWSILYGLFTGHDNTPSLSLFQVFLWTLVTMWALVYVLLRTMAPVNLTLQIMTLLGFAGVSSVAARWIGSSRFPGGSAPKEGDVKSFSTMLMTDGRPDLLKLQLLGFTLFAASYVLARVAQNSAFPELDENLLLLMGVSNLTYLGGKLAEATPEQKAETLHRAREAAATQKKTLEVYLTEQKAKRTTKLAEQQKEQDPAKKVTIDNELQLIEAEIVRIEGRSNVGGQPAVSGELEKAKNDLISIDKALQEMKIAPTRG